MSDQERKAFEKEFPVPEGVEWIGNGYAPTRYSADQGYNRMWKAWQSRAQSDGGEALGWVHGKALKKLEAGHPVLVYNFDTPIVFDSKVPVYTHPPAANQGVPESYAKEKLASALRQFRHNNDNSGAVDKPEKGFVFAYDKQAVDELVATLTTPKAIGGWVKCSERLPTEDHPFECWYSSNGEAPSLMSSGSVSWNYGHGNAPNAKWMPTGLKRPAPPQQQEKGDE